jgi:hypothetical protein
LRISRWTGQLSFQSGERLDDLRGLEGSVTATDRDLLEDASIDKSNDGFVGLNEAPVDHLGGAVDGDNWGSDENSQEQISSGAGTNSTEALAPCGLDGTCALLEGGRVIHRPSAGSGKATDP